VKAISVSQDGTPDGFAPPIAYRVDVSPDGVTRIAVSAGPKLLMVLDALVGALQGPVGVLWVRMVDRARGKQLPKPEHYVAIEKPQAQVGSVLARCRNLLTMDGRGQLWLRGGFKDQVVLDELGVVYCYPDDPAFRDALEAIGLREQPHTNMEDRDYVKVNFSALADAEEQLLIRELGLSLRSD
jgi:hypothetical protein